jgi:hypothetical protein
MHTRRAEIAVKNKNDKKDVRSIGSIVKSTSNLAHNYRLRRAGCKKLVEQAQSSRWTNSTGTL